MVEPVTIGAVIAGVLLAGATALAENALGAAGKDAYAKLKAIVSKFAGHDVTELERTKSEARARVLAELIEKQSEVDDKALSQAADALRRILEAEGHGPMVDHRVTVIAAGVAATAAGRDLYIGIPPEQLPAILAAARGKVDAYPHTRLRRFIPNSIFARLDRDAHEQRIRDHIYRMHSMGAEHPLVVVLMHELYDQHELFINERFRDIVWPSGLDGSPLNIIRARIFWPHRELQGNYKQRYNTYQRNTIEGLAAALIQGSSLNISLEAIRKKLDSYCIHNQSSCIIEYTISESSHWTNHDFQLLFDCIHDWLCYKVPQSECMFFVFFCLATEPQLHQKNAWIRSDLRWPILWRFLRKPRTMRDSFACLEQLSSGRTDIRHPKHWVRRLAARLAASSAANESSPFNNLVCLPPLSLITRDDAYEWATQRTRSVITDEYDRRELENCIVEIFEEKKEWRLLKFRKALEEKYCIFNAFA